MCVFQATNAEENVEFLIYTIMKKFIKIMVEDYRKDSFTQKNYVVYGIIAPIVLFGLMVLAGYIEQLTK